MLLGLRRHTRAYSRTDCSPDGHAGCSPDGHADLCAVLRAHCPAIIGAVAVADHNKPHGQANGKPDGRSDSFTYGITDRSAECRADRCTEWCS